jgi:hypothetical protein
LGCLVLILLFFSYYYAKTFGTKFFRFFSKSLQSPPGNFAANLVNYFTVAFALDESKIKAVVEDPHEPFPVGCYPKNMGCHCCPLGFF